MISRGEALGNQPTKVGFFRKRSSQPEVANPAISAIITADQLVTCFAALSRDQEIHSPNIICRNLGMFIFLQEVRGTFTEDRIEQAIRSPAVESSPDHDNF